MSVSSTSTDTANIIVQYCPRKNINENIQLQLILSQFFSNLPRADDQTPNYLAPIPALLPPPTKKDPHLPAGKEVGLENRKFWKPCDRVGSTFTDPTDFDPNSFQFLVTVINSTRFKRVIENPEADFENRLMSCSVINQEKTTTFSFNCGVILRVPPENIYATSPKDLFLANSAKTKGPEKLNQELFRVNQLYPIREPAEILERSSKTEINEVAVLGKTEHGVVQVIGVFRKVLVDASGQCVLKGKKKQKVYPDTDKTMDPLLTKFAKSRGLPEVEIPICYLTEKQKEQQKAKQNKFRDSRASRTKAKSDHAYKETIQQRGIAKTGKTKLSSKTSTSPKGSVEVDLSSGKPPKTKKKWISR
jgi:hypothetical protein